MIKTTITRWTFKQTGDNLTDRDDVFVNKYGDNIYEIYQRGAKPLLLNRAQAEAIVEALTSAFAFQLTEEKGESQ